MPDKATGRASVDLSVVVPDDHLRAMITDNPNAVCSLIVEAQLPAREFTFAQEGSKRLSHVAGESEDERAVELLKLASRLKELAENGEAKVLKAAGAVVIKAPAKRLSELSLVQGVKTIRENRKLPPVRGGNSVV